MKLTETDKRDIALAIALEIEGDQHPSAYCDTSTEDVSGIWHVDLQTLKRVIHGRALIRKLNSIT